VKSKLAIIVVLFGWGIFITYILSDIREYGSDAFQHFLSLRKPTEHTLHALLMLLAPVGAHILGYLINERRKLLERSRLSEENLKYSTEEWKTTFDAMPYGVLITDNEYNVIKMNKFISTLSGVPVKEEGYSKKCYELVHKRDTPPDDCLFVKAVKTQKTIKFEFYDEAMNKHFMESVTPVFRKEGKASAYVHIFFDVSDSREKEIKLTEAKDAFFNMLKDLDFMYKEQKDIYNNLVVAFSNVIDAKSPWTKHHSRNVTAYAVTIAREMGLKENDIEITRTTGLLHDIGKMGTYDVILDKPDKLTDEEFELVKKHPAKGEEILKPIKGLEDILPIIRSHHEKIDGTGYPDGLKGDKIPLIAKIICVADSYDSMM
jgi:putative nucleotidyltransferase with HDIG domain